MFRWFKNQREDSKVLASKRMQQCQQLCHDGCTRQTEGDSQGALANFEQVVTLDPNHAEAHFLLGEWHEQHGDLAKAATHYQRAVALKPGFELACLRACRMLIQSGQIAAGSRMIATGLAMNPADAELHVLEGNVYLLSDAFESALESYREALKLGANTSLLHGLIGGLSLKRNDLGTAMFHLQRAIELDPNNMAAHHDAGVVHICLGNVEQAIQHQETVIAHEPWQLQAYSCLLFALSSSVECTPQRYLQTASDYSVQVRKTAGKLPERPDSASNTTNQLTPLRIGWVSGDLRQHVNQAFLKHVLIRLADEPIEMLAFSNNPYDDATTQELRQLMTQWHDISQLSDRDAAGLIHACQVDILIDLSGHTAHNRLPVFAWRPAPVQVSWLGFFASTGLCEMDYLIADPLSVPVQWHSHFSEKIVYLPDTRLCMAPPRSSDALRVAPLPACTNGYVTFGCFQVLSKINDSVLTAWRQIMNLVPDSRLRLQIRYLTLPGVREALQSRMEQIGMAMDRVVLLDGVLAKDYLLAHHQVDIILDTFPYPGGTTTAEALWMGVPTVTLKGNSLLARQGASMLHNAGLQDWIAEDAADYVKRAVQHASGIDALAELRQRLRQQALASPLFDSQRFTTHFLAALHGMRRPR